MNDYETWSDFDINKRVGFLQGKIKKGKTAKYYEKFCPDYCNKPRDAWPIIAENKIDIRFELDEPRTATATAPEYLPAWVDKNPLRAAMIVYLMMQESR